MISYTLFVILKGIEHISVVCEISLSKLRLDLHRNRCWGTIYILKKWYTPPPLVKKALFPGEPTWCRGDSLVIRQEQRHWLSGSCRASKDSSRSSQSYHPPFEVIVNSKLVFSSIPVTESCQQLVCISWSAKYFWNNLDSLFDVWWLMSKIRENKMQAAGITSLASTLPLLSASLTDLDLRYFVSPVLITTKHRTLVLSKMSYFSMCTT